MNRTTQELRAYVLSHREDIAALHAFIDRPNPEPNTPAPTPPKTSRLMHQAIREKLGR
jgi:hypothetical protein